MKDEEKSFLLHKVFVDITKGFSASTEGDDLIYIKHFGLTDQVELDSFYHAIFDKAAAKGLPTEEERLEFLTQEGVWGKKQEEDIAKKKVLYQGLGGKPCKANN